MPEAALHRTNKTEAFVCNDGCVVEPYYDECQCSGCEENPFFDCNTCGGCPSTCGFWVSCPSTFACFSGASKPVYVFLDDKCDCELCEDEEWWTYFSCGDCPLDAASDAAVDCTAVPFTCDDGCEISSTMVNNYRQAFLQRQHRAALGAGMVEVSQLPEEERRDGPEDLS